MKKSAIPKRHPSVKIRLSVDKAIDALLQAKPKTPVKTAHLKAQRTKE